MENRLRFAKTTKKYQHCAVVGSYDKTVVEACHPDCQSVKMKCLSVRQPWVDAIFELGKDVENRSWRTPYRGPLLIQASKTIDREGVCVGGCGSCCERESFVTGAILGIVDLTDVVDKSASGWAEADCWHWLLANPRLLAEPIPCAGKPGIFEVEIPLGALKGAKSCE
jgi:hypothetical protein